MTATAEKLTRLAVHPDVAIPTLPFNPPAKRRRRRRRPSQGIPSLLPPPTPQLASNLGKTANRMSTRPLCLETLDTCAMTPPSIYDNLPFSAS
jgi:hypothetical protein